MRCQNPEMCAEKYKRWKRNQDKYIPIGEREHEAFVDKFEEGLVSLTTTIHYIDRSLERALNNRDLVDIFTCGWVVERQFDAEQGVNRLSILGYTSSYRPIRLVVQTTETDKWEIVTAFDPRSKAHKWSDDYEERICFCKDIKDYFFN